MNVIRPAALVLPAITALLFAVPAASQSAADAPIVVTGQKNLEEQIDSFVGALTKAPVTGQLAKFETEICPAALGLPDSYRTAVEQRIRLVAKEVGLRVAKEKCAANVLVMVTTDKAQLLKTLKTKYSYFFSNKTPSEYRAIIAQPGPTAAWQIERMLNADGAPMPISEEGFAINQTTRSGSRMTAAARPTFSAAAVVVEASALVGLSATQLADYAVMRTFARTDPALLGASAPPTILNIMEAPDDAEVPITMTQWDFGFLKGLYAAPKNLRASAERSQIGSVLQGELEKPGNAPGAE